MGEKIDFRGTLFYKQSDGTYRPICPCDSIVTSFIDPDLPVEEQVKIKLLLEEK